MLYPSTDLGTILFEYWLSVLCRKEIRTMDTSSASSSFSFSDIGKLSFTYIFGVFRLALSLSAIINIVVCTFEM